MNVNLARATAICTAQGRGVSLVYSNRNRVIAVNPGNVTIETAQANQSDYSRRDHGIAVRVEFREN